MKIILRSFIKRKASFVTILASLIIAFTSVFLIGGYNVHELTADDFHSNKKRIFQLQSDDPWEQGAKFAYITHEAPEYIKSNFPEVEDYCQWNKNGYEKIEVNEAKFFKGMTILETQASFFNIFSFPVKNGDTKTLLKNKSDIILSEETALKFFGDDDPMGKPVKVKHRGGEKTYFVSGVLKKHSTTHLEFDMLTSIEGKKMRGSRAYLLLKPNTDPNNFEKKLQAVHTEIPFFGKGENAVNYYLQNLTDIYKSKDVIRKIIIFSIIALVILFIAFFNYINLFITQIYERTNDLSIRRIIGGSLNVITKNIAAEFLVLIASSIVLSAACAYLLLPLFNEINEVQLLFSDFINWQVLLIIFMTSGVVGIISLLLVRFKIKKHFSSHESIVRKSKQIPLISTFQFAVSTALIIFTIVIFKQINFIHNKNIGLNRDAIEMRVPSPDREKSKILQEEIRKHPLVNQVSVCSASPLREGAMVLYRYEKQGKMVEYSPLFFQGDHSYIDVLGIKLIEGRNFYETAPQNKNKCLINQSMVEFLELDSPIGKLLPGSNNEIIGVVEDFHWRELDFKIPPSIIAFNDHGSNLIVQTTGNVQSEAINHIKNSWNKIIPDYPFEYWTTGDLFNQKHKKHEIMVRFVFFFCLIAIFLTVIGVIARTVIVIKHRTKEIGIRKVNGATVKEVLTLINTSFLKWVGLSIVVALPISYYTMNKWLENFAYKTTLSWWIFALAGVLALGIALLTVSLQSWRAATRNPVEALRYE